MCNKNNSEPLTRVFALVCLWQIRRGDPAETGQAVQTRIFALLMNINNKTKLCVPKSPTRKPLAASLNDRLLHKNNINYITNF